MWISHFVFFDLDYDIWRENDEDVPGDMVTGDTMEYLEEIILLSKKNKRQEPTNSRHLYPPFIQEVASLFFTGEQIEHPKRISLAFVSISETVATLSSSPAA